jgi:hypothetical protein
MHKDKKLLPLDRMTLLEYLDLLINRNDQSNIAFLIESEKRNYPELTTLEILDGLRETCRIHLNNSKESFIDIINKPSIHLNKAYPKDLAAILNVITSTLFSSFKRDCIIPTATKNPLVFNICSQLFTDYEIVNIIHGIKKLLRNKSDMEFAAFLLFICVTKYQVPESSSVINLLLTSDIDRNIFKHESKEGTSRSYRLNDFIMTWFDCVLKHTTKNIYLCFDIEGIQEKFSKFLEICFINRYEQSVRKLSIQSFTNIDGSISENQTSNIQFLQKWKELDSIDI